MDDYTQDELFLMMLYSPGNRPGLIKALQEMKLCLAADEAELMQLTETVLKKLTNMSDTAFERLDLYRDL